MSHCRTQFCILSHTKETLAHTNMTVAHTRKKNFVCAAVIFVCANVSFVCASVSFVCVNRFMPKIYVEFYWIFRDYPTLCFYLSSCWQSYLIWKHNTENKFQTDNQIFIIQNLRFIYWRDQAIEGNVRHKPSSYKIRK